MSYHLMECVREKLATYGTSSVHAVFFVAGLVLVAVFILISFKMGFFIQHSHAEHAMSYVTASGTDATGANPRAFTAGEITALSALGGTNMATNGNWPKNASTYDEAHYLEFVFTPSIPADAIISSISLTNVYKRNNTLTEAKLEIWDGTDWSHSSALTIPADTTSYVTDIIQLSSYINTPAKANNIKARFLAYRSNNGNVKTNHDFIQLQIHYTYNPTVVSVTIAPADPETNDTLGVTVNAVDPDGDPLTTHYQWKKNGATVGTDASTLDLSQAGYGDKNDTITVLATVNDSFGGTASKLSDPVTVQNSAPVVTAKSVTTAENVPIDISLAGTDADNDPLTYDIVLDPIHGHVSVSGSIATYAPNPYYNGSDSFTFEADDGTVRSTYMEAVISITPVNYPPVALDQTVTTEEHIPATIVLLANDPDLDAMTYSIESQPSNGTLGAIFETNKVTYTPANHFFGTDTFTFKAHDAEFASNLGTATISVAEVNDAPTASNGLVSTAENTAKIIALAGSDPKGMPVSFIIVPGGGPYHGTLGSVSGNTVTYTPHLNYNGSDTFYFKANDGLLDSNIATETIIVTAVNVPPSIANIHDFASDEGKSLNIIPVVSDPESPPEVLTFSLSAAPAGAAMSRTTGVFSWTPTEAQGPGSYPVTITVSDGNLSGSVSFTVTVNEVNTPPQAENISTGIIESTPASFNLAATDADIPANTLTFEIIGQPFHGTLTVSGKKATYIPNDRFAGLDSFEYVAYDGSAYSRMATVNLEVASPASGSTRPYVPPMTSGEEQKQPPESGSASISASGTPASPENFGLNAGALVSVGMPYDPDVYVVNRYGYKHLILSPLVMSFYPDFTFSEVKKITDVELGAFITTPYVRGCSVDKPDIYAMEVMGEDEAKLVRIDMAADEVIKVDPNFFQKIFCASIQEMDLLKSNESAQTLSGIPDYSRFSK